MTFFDGRDLVFLRRVYLFYTIFGEVFGECFARLLILSIVLVAGQFAAFFLFGAQASFFFSCLGLFCQQLFAILLRDLVIIRMNFAEGEETVTVAAEVDESCLQRWFDPGYLGEVNVAFDLLVFSRFKIKLITHFQS